MFANDECNLQLLQAFCMQLFRPEVSETTSVSRLHQNNTQHRLYTPFPSAFVLLRARSISVIWHYSHQYYYQLPKLLNERFPFSQRFSTGRGFVQVKRQSTSRSKTDVPTKRSSLKRESNILIVIFLVLFEYITPPYSKLTTSACNRREAFKR